LAPQAPPHEHRGCKSIVEQEDVMQAEQLLDCAGRRRSPATLASFHQGHSPRNKGLRYPPDPLTVEEIIAVMRAAGEDPDEIRLRGLIVVLWRAGPRISEALALSETDLDAARAAILVRQGKGGKRREVGMDRWAWDQLQPWLALRPTLPVGALFCILRGPTRGRRCSPAGIRAQLRRTAYLRGIDNTEIIQAVHERPSPMIPATASLTPTR
jgi:site-specific recombinase XerC